MAEEDDFYGEERSPSGRLLLLIGLSLLLALGALAWSYSLQARLSTLETQLSGAREERVRLESEQAETQRQLIAAREASETKTAVTQRQIERRAQQILHQQQAATDRLTEQEAETRQQVGSVSKAVSNVRTDVGGVKQDVATTKKDVASNKQELADTEEQLHAVIGDLGVQSGLIAKNQEQLEYLRHLGDRNYLEFTLRKGQRPTELSTIKLQLRKADVKHSRYTLEVFSDDKRLEKKNRELNEPLQFYTGKQPELYEIVVNRIGKNEISGYLSTPKDLPQPGTP